MNQYDINRINEAEIRAETAEEELKLRQERIKEWEGRFDRLYDQYRALVANTGGDGRDGTEPGEVIP